MRCIVSPAPTPGVANGARYVVALPFPRSANGGSRGTRSHVPIHDAEASTNVAYPGANGTACSGWPRPASPKRPQRCAELADLTAGQARGLRERPPPLPRAAVTWYWIPRCERSTRPPSSGADW